MKNFYFWTNNKVLIKYAKENLWLPLDWDRTTRNYYKYINWNWSYSDNSEWDYIYNLQNLKDISSWYYKEWDIFIYEKWKFQYRKLTFDIASEFWNKNKDEILNLEKKFIKEEEQFLIEKKKKEKVEEENAKLNELEERFIRITEDINLLIKDSDNRDEILIRVAWMYEKYFKKINKKKIFNFNF